MNKVRVEVFYQDNALQSIRIDHYEMEGLVAIENKTIPEWFMPASGRASWKGLKEKLESQSRKKGELCFIFNGPEEEKAIFQKCIQENKLGRMADELEIEETALEYLEIAQHCWQHGDDEGTLRAYEIAAKWYHMAEAEFVLGDYCERVLGDNENAVQWFRKAAKQGYTDAEYRYGKCLENGTAVPESKTDTAVSWYQKAAAQGQKDAAQELELRRQAQIEAERRKQAEEAERQRIAKEEAERRRRAEEEARAKKKELIIPVNVPSSETVETPFKPDYISLQKAAETGRDKKYKNKTSLEKAAFWNEVAQNAKESRQAVDKKAEEACANIWCSRKAQREIRKSAANTKMMTGTVQLVAELVSSVYESIGCEEEKMLENMEIIE